MLLAVVFVLGIFVGCSSDKKDENSDGTPVINDTVFFKGKVEYKNADGESVYSVVRPEGDADLLPLSQKVFKAIKSAIGVNPKNQTDDTDGTDKYEILIGDTNRPETETAKLYLKQKLGGRYDDFIVCTIGKKIVIYSQNENNLENAVDYFVANFVKAEGVDGGVLYTEAAKGNFDDVTINGALLSEFKFIRPQFNSSYLTELAMENVAKTIYENTGYMLEIRHDVDVEAGDYEIIVGNTNRGNDIMTDVDAFSITVSGKKVVLNGGSAHATAMAVSEFGKLLKGDVKDTVVNGSYNATIGTYDKATTMSYAWGDDFDGDTLDTSKWYQSTPKESGVKGENGKTSVRSDDPSDVFLNDGKFHICARQDESYYYGGRITSQKTMRYKYGYLEMSAVLPHGTDFWVALWACGDAGQATAEQYNMYPEIDVVECFGNSAMYYANCHSWPTVLGESNGFEHTSLDNTHANEKKYQCPDSKLLTNDFHTYGMMWTEDAMSFVCDGDAYFTYDFRDDNEDKNTFNQEMYIIISMALGFDSNSMSINDATPEDWQNTNKYIVDWINIYQKDDGKSYVRLN